jgi:hypothetical protein
MLAQLKLNMTRQMVRIPTRVLFITLPPLWFSRGPGRDIDILAEAAGERNPDYFLGVALARFA